MKIRTLILAALLTLCVAATAYAGTECNAEPWGQPIAAVEQITFDRMAGSVKYYKVTKVEPCGIFAIENADVTYAFTDGKLYASIVEINQARNIKKVVALLMEKYGLPDHKVDSGWDVYRWETDELKIKVKSQYSSDRIKIGTYYKPLIPQD